MDRRTDTERAGGLEQGPGRLPNFIIIGAAKSGTTSLLRYIEGHPDVFMVSDREVRFFDRNKLYERGPDWYRQHFAGAGDKKIVGEKTPSYLASPQAHERMAALVPDAKLAAILRNPVDRAYSHYAMTETLRPTPQSFEELVRREMADPAAPPLRPHVKYLAQSQYIDQLRRLTDFYPRSAVLVMTMDDLISDPAAIVATICRFLEIDDTWQSPTLGAAYNVTVQVQREGLRKLLNRASAGELASRIVTKVDRVDLEGGYPPLDPRLRVELLEWFRPYNAALTEWMGRDLSAWDS